MTAVSTSNCKISGDVKNPFFKKMSYLFTNWKDNLAPYRKVDDSLEIAPYVCADLPAYWEKLKQYAPSSPSRMLSNLFWSTLPWEAMEAELGKINIFDIGCGKGNYSWRFNDWSSKRVHKYTGVDIAESENWAALRSEYPNYSFLACNADDTLNKIPEDTTVIVTQSAIEHFENDLLFFDNLKTFITTSKKNIVQIHLFPSYSCLFLYFLHGYRQYTPRSVSPIASLYKDFSYLKVFKLGGKKCNKLHFDYITIPSNIGKKGDKRKDSPEKYQQLLYNAIDFDMKHDSKEASFYALVIHSHYSKKLF